MVLALNKKNNMGVRCSPPPGKLNTVITTLWGTAKMMHIVYF
jgi:hypothetical protein